ncbi:ABC transporter substrate-binding protein [Enterovirga sp.]|uniref:ABC transporter substrate-binding protein n=1 Tax=Enterovirga sp. TaxID=2026350 RepID=UPI002636EEE1|nr:ABC transporter substrate-binding protein [Enterovirga sp.]MDB5591227.1 putative signal peptide protein [Enterovirga sp.]
MISRRTVLAGLAAAAGGGPLRAQQPAVELADVHIGVGGRASLYYLPLTVAERLGYFREEGLTPRFSDFTGGSRTMQALVGGSIDVASGAFEHVVSIQPKGLRIQAFVAQGRYPNFAFAISRKLAATYRSPADLKGARIGVTAPGAGSQTFAEIILARGGLGPKDVSFIGVGSGASAIAALLHDRIDAISNIDPAVTQAERTAGAKIIYDVRTTEGTRDLFGGPVPSGCLYTEEAFVQSRPGTVQALTNAMVRSLVWLRTAQPADLLAVVPPAYLAGDPDLYLAAFEKGREGISKDGRIGIEGARNTLKTLLRAERSLSESQFQLETTFTDRFVEKALARFG